MKVVKKSAFSDFVGALIEDKPGAVVGVKSKLGKFIYDTLGSAEELCLDYDVTVMPPKGYLMPSCEAVLKYQLGGGLAVQPVNEVQPRVIIGIHPYDLIAIEQMDAVFKDTNRDDNYLKKRDEVVLIGVNMERASAHSFAGSMGTATTNRGFDLMLTKIGDKYAIEEGSAKGSELLKKYGKKISDADDSVKKEVDLKKTGILSGFRKKVAVSPKELAPLLSANWNHTVWETNAKTCLSCGSCNLVCPTCYCFDVQDVTELNLKDGNRVRMWDGCLLEGFAKVGTGENFREHRSSRYRHRFMRKGKYLPDKFGFVACVGCGRCASACLPDIADPTKVFNTLKEGSKK